jgi:hypothetical protein
MASFAVTACFPQVRNTKDTAKGGKGAPECKKLHTQEKHPLRQRANVVCNRRERAVAGLYRTAGFMQGEHCAISDQAVCNAVG